MLYNFRPYTPNQVITMKTFKLFLIASIYLILSGCQQQDKPKTEIDKAMERDSFSRKMYGESADEHIKKMVNQNIAKAAFDTVGLHSAPVKVLQAKIVKEEYSNYRSVFLKYKNISKKTVSGIKFQWYGTNAFNEPADLGSTYAAGFGGGFTDDPLRPGRSEGSTWNVLSRDAKKLKLAWPIEVSFSDGTSWKLMH
ncbi:hypothetical protein A0256_23630 [Mucilaginibacter sp. PAMC 26640]|nr:hypothetical protein A0256_23630 [Mucilaginibacter sp. PAMC 26640]